MIPACDVSQYQGIVDWATMPEEIIMIKMSGGDAGLYMDSMASADYTGAKNSGKHVGGYHFIGWTVGATAEATYFLQAMSPLAENDVYALDIESIPVGLNPVPYVAEMVNLIHDKINVYPLLYMNLSTLRSFNWTSLLANCGLWLADWNNDPAGTIPSVPIYVMQQYSDGPAYDHDEWFGTVAEFDAYGYHFPTSSQITPPPVVVAPAVVSTPEVVQTTTPVVKPVETPVNTPQVTPIIMQPVGTTQKQNTIDIPTQVLKTTNSSSWLTKLLNWLFSWIKGV